jgi:GNAT superfamily N-acetyltransferase
MSARTQNLAITGIDADDPAAVDARYHIEAAARAADHPDLPPPCRYRLAAALRHPYPGVDIEQFLAHLDGEPVGYVIVELPTLDNLENSYVELVVHPAYRRRGVGRFMYAHALETVRAAGRRRVMASSTRQVPGGPERDGAGSAFAEAMGLQPALTDIRRKLEVSHVDPAVHDRLLAEAWARADGYSLVKWRDRVPDEYVDDVAYLDGRLVTDAPMGDLALEPERIDAARVRQREEAQAARGTRSYAAGMRHDASGRLVALTALGLEKTIPEHAWQWITLVDPDHRGHRLGTIVKIENLRYALEHETALRSIDTWNAESNAYMISINDAMGFRAIDAGVEWQVEIG